MQNLQRSLSLCWKPLAIAYKLPESIEILKKATASPSAQTGILGQVLSVLPTSFRGNKNIDFSLIELRKTSKDESHEKAMYLPNQSIVDSNLAWRHYP